MVDLFAPFRNIFQGAPQPLTASPISPPPQPEPLVKGAISADAQGILTQEIAAPSVTGVRPVVTGYPADGMTPDRLTSLLRAADAGDPLRYFELAEAIEERDLHYVAVLGTRKRSVAQIQIQVDPASESAADKEIAKTISDWLDRDTLADELFDLMDAVGKGISFTEITWDISTGQWQPVRLDLRDPRWFRFDYIDGRTPLLRTDVGAVPLPPSKFIVANLQAKSGLPIRSGLARMASWAWLFKSYTQRDWQVFLQSYGQPVRIGKYDTSSTEADRKVLLRAVANIAGDCAAIIPDTMQIEFIEGKNVASSTEAYLQRADWLDQQISKAVLGQTATTDAINGGHAVGKTHRQVQKDITVADCKAVSAILNRDLVRPWINMQFGPQAVYPRIRIEEPEEQDVQLIATALSLLVPLGLKVSQNEVRDKIGFNDPDPGDELLEAPPPPPAPDFGMHPPGDPSGVPRGKPGTTAKPPAPEAATEKLATQIALQLAHLKPDQDSVDAATTEILKNDGWQPLITPMIAGLQDKLAHATSLDDVRATLAAHLATMNVADLADVLAKGSFSARIAGLANEQLSSKQ